MDVSKDESTPSKDHTRTKKQSMQSAENDLQNEDVNQCRFGIIYKMLRKITSSQENAQSEIAQLKQEVKTLTLMLEHAHKETDNNNMHPQRSYTFVRDTEISKVCLGEESEAEIQAEATLPHNEKHGQPECNAVSEMELEAKIQANANSPHNNAINYGQPECNAVSEMELEADLTDARNGWDNKEMTAKVNRISVRSRDKKRIHSIQLRKCYYCGLRHKFGTHICTAFGKTCKKCGKKNHTANVCQSTPEGKCADPDITMIVIHHPDTMILIDRHQDWEVFPIKGQHFNARMVLQRLKEFARPHKKQQTVRIRIGKKNPECEIRQLEYELTQLTNKFHFHVKQERLPGSMMEQIYENFRRIFPRREEKLTKNQYISQHTSDDECTSEDECSSDEELDYTHLPKPMDLSKDWEASWKLFKKEFQTFRSENSSFEYQTQDAQCDVLLNAMGPEIPENMALQEISSYGINLVDLMEWFDKEFTTWKRKKRMTEQKKYRREGMS